MIKSEPNGSGVTEGGCEARRGAETSTEVQLPVQCPEGMERTCAPSQLPTLPLHQNKPEQLVAERPGDCARRSETRTSSKCSKGQSNLEAAQREDTTERRTKRLLGALCSCAAGSSSSHCESCWQPGCYSDVFCGEPGAVRVGATWQVGFVTGALRVWSCDAINGSRAILAVGVWRLAVGRQALGPVCRHSGWGW